MPSKHLSDLTDQELLAESKKLKSFSIVNALLIGFLAGIIFYSIAKNSWGMVSIIPLFFIYQLVNDPKNKRIKEVEELLKERNLN